MLKRKFRFPVSDEHFPFGLEKPLPPQHPLEASKHAPKQQIPLPASAFLFPPKKPACSQTATLQHRMHQLTEDLSRSYRSSLFLPQFLRS